MHESMGNSMAADPVAPDDMPCCPGKPSLPDCGKDCPLMALCSAAPLYFVSQIGLIVPTNFATIIFPSDQSDLGSVAHAPPQRPPNI